ncbi:MAG TPA: ABC transporter permease [Gemmatimonadaceae bacterium]|jgi:putative ABC transport system permease protein
MRSAFRWFSREAGLRFLARRKAACTVAVLTMALALGANTAVFSVVRTFLLASIGVPDAQRLFLLAPVRNLPGRGSVVFNEAYPNYELIRRTQHAFADVTCIAQGVAGWDDHGESRPLQTARVTASFFSTVRVFPILGRGFTAAEEGPPPTRVVVISNALWHSAFNADRSVIGSALILNGEPHTIIGVMPEGFTQPVPTDVWLPFDLPPQARIAVTGARTLTVYARLAEGMPRARADAEARDLTKRALAATSENRDFWYEARPLRGVLLDGADSTVLLVQAGAVVLLLLAILNLASLLLAWGFERGQELAVRQALGAGQVRVVRMLFLQGVVVVGVGAALGVGLTRLIVPWLRHLDLNQSVAFFTSQITLDGSVLLASATVAILSGLAAGVLPAVFTRNSDVATTLRSGARSATLSPAALRWQQAMVVVQAALSVVILTAAALIGVSFAKLVRVPIGFVPRDLLVARVNLQNAVYLQASARVRFGRDLLDNLAHEPEIASAAFTTTLPVSDGLWGGRFFVELPDGSLSTEPSLLHIRRTSTNYLPTIGIPLLTGRQFATSDDSASPNVAIVSRSLAAHLWPNQSAIGKRIYRLAAGKTQPVAHEVVGVVGDVMDAGNSVPPGETVYLPWGQVSTTQLSIVVRPRAGDAAAFAAVRRALRHTDLVVATHDEAPLEALVTQANALPRLQSLLLLTFAIAALGIATLGSYGVMSQLVSTREREYALRLVFGAVPSQLGRSVLTQVGRLTLPGVAAGLVAVVLLGGTLKRFVFGVEPRSVVVLSLVSVGMLLVALAATLPSMRRAMRVDIRRTIGAQ